MRWHIIRTLLGKEVRRQLANRGGIALALLLVVASLLMAFFAKKGEQQGILQGGVEYCFLDYWRDDAWVRHLIDHVPPELKPQLKIRDIRKVHGPDDRILYPPSCGAIQMRVESDGTGQERFRVWMWYPDKAGTSLAAFETWFWRETARFFQGQVQEATGALQTQIAADRTRLEGGVDLRTSLTAALVLFALFFSCVYLMPSFLCEERERGILLAQALSPASAWDILLAKFLFYPTAGIVLATLLAGIANPNVLTLGFFWLVLVVAAFGSLGIGLTIACVAGTQRTASMGAMCYMLMMALFLWICQRGNIPFVSWLALEYHCPRMLHAALVGAVEWFHWANLGMAALLAVAWAILACRLFRARGWQ